MPTRLASLDLGTNTFHLLIADVAENKIHQVLLSEQRHVKLGEGGIDRGMITDAAFDRGLAALSEFKSFIDRYNVKKIRAVGTAALRTAQNGMHFIAKARLDTGLEIEIIDGNREASLIYLGVKQAVDLNQCCLIMDIGGGSVEFIFANDEGIKWKNSYPIGAAKLMAAYHKTDPISLMEISDVNYHLKEVLSDLLLKAGEIRSKLLIGSAGAFETFASLCQTQHNDNQQITTNYDFDMARLNRILSDIVKSSHHQRMKNPNIPEVRKDMIVVASIITNFIISQLGIENVKLSTFALKEGLLFEPPYVC